MLCQPYQLPKQLNFIIIYLMKSFSLPDEITEILEALTKAGFEAFAVGGCVRDMLAKKEPKDWDITTNARPEEIQKIFPRNFCENKFGTVTVLTNSQSPSLKEVQITPYRTETTYSDRRHPDEIKWVKTLEEDLARRDFTVNALAIDLDQKIIDLFDGQKDFKAKIIKAVGDPDQRFNEDAWRLIRAVRFATVLGFEIEEKTKEAIVKNAKLLSLVSQERIRDELLKIIACSEAANGIEMLRVLGLLKYILPEVEAGYGIGQNKHHKFDCYNHYLKSLDFAAKKGFSMHVRMAALLHDIAKPATKHGDGQDSTFYNHEIVGAKQAKKALERLKFPNKDTDKIVLLVRYHLFYYNVGEVTESSIRRLVRNVGPENMPELLELRQSDRVGSGCPKAEPYKLRHLQYLIDKVSQDPITPKMIKLDGTQVMEMLDLSPSPRVGFILNILLADVLNDPKFNEKSSLTARAKELNKLNDEQLKKLSMTAKKEIETVVAKEDKMTKDKYWVS